MAQDSSTDMEEASSSNYHSLPEETAGTKGGVGIESRTLFHDEPASVSVEQAPLFSASLEATLITVCYMSLASMLGSFLRIILAQLFGEECKNPGTVGWLAAASPLCVTNDGVVSQVGGIVFADFPANMLGSFFMGMMLSGDRLLLPISIPIAFLDKDHAFQQWDVIHLAIRTGFCGSLTTFSSWNSDMVVMMFGAGNTHSQVARAVFGYLIGMETSMGSFVFGSKVAWWIHRNINPDLAKEADAIIQRKEEGVYIHNQLPDFERRFLLDLVMELESHDEKALSQLELWRQSTIEARRVGNANLSNLIDIETCILVHREHLVSPELEEIAQANGWNLNALLKWFQYKYADQTTIDPLLMDAKKFTLKGALLCLFVVYVLLFWGLAVINSDDSYSITYRTMIFAAIVAPSGALLRWQLGKYNGTFRWELWSWIPVGTLTANILGCIVSIVAIATELRLNQDGDFSFWVIGTLRAIKIGFAGSLTTVSTFVSEVSLFMKSPMLPYRAYLYILLTLASCNAIGTLLYATIVYII